MEPEFLDPGPNQPEPTPYPNAPGQHAPAPCMPGPYAPTSYAPAPYAPYPYEPAQYGPARPTRRDVTGLVIMLLAAAVLPLVASSQPLFAVRERTLASANGYAVDAWGRFDGAAGPQLYAHGPRFGVALVATGVGFAILLLCGGVALLGGRSPEPQRASGLIAGAATGLLGLLVGTVIAMTLEIQSVYDTLREVAGTGATPIVEVRLRVGGAVFVAVAGVLAAGLAVSAALRVRRATGRSMAHQQAHHAVDHAAGHVAGPVAHPTPGEAVTWR